MTENTADWISSVSYAVFDTAVGNTIAATVPAEVNLDSFLDTRSPADYCFPDGAHDCFTACVPVTLKILPTARKPRCVPASQDHIFGLATYHLKKDAAVHRGATQRSMLILTWRPMFVALSEVAKQAIFPFFDTVNVADKDAHVAFVDHLFQSLREAFEAPEVVAQLDSSPPKATLEESVLQEGEEPATPRTRRRRAMSGVDGKGTIRRVQGTDQLHCTLRTVDVSLPDQPTPSTSPQATAVGEGSAAASFARRMNPHRQILMRLPLEGASLVGQLSFGSSIKKLIKWLGSNIALVHWSLLCRFPVLFVGLVADQVAEAVCACVHLLRPIEVDITRFAPFVTIEHSDYLRKNVSNSVYLAIGTTNAYLRETEFPGVVKCDINNGSVRFADGKEPRIPKRVKATFVDVISAANDDEVKEAYIRARLLRFNLGILQQFEKKKGPYYDFLCRQPNLIDTPLQALSRETEVEEMSDGSFLVLGDESTNSPPEDATEDAEVDVSPEAPSALRSIHNTLETYHEAASKNVEIIKELEIWYKNIISVLRTTLYQSSGEPQQALFDELAGFNVDADRLKDPTIYFCGSEVEEGLNALRNLERSLRLRFAVDYKERCFLLVDSFCKNNPRVLRRKGNRLFSDFFNFPDCALYGFPSQVLFFKTSCTLVTYHRRLRIKTSGTIYVSRNYLCFEAGSLAIKKRHQIFPFDVMTAVSQEKTGKLFSATIKVMMDFGDGETCMAVLSNLGTSKGFFEILQLLFHRQKRLQKLMSNIPTLIQPPRSTIGGGMLCPLTIPAGLYCNPAAEYIEEVWENQRQYPIIGWSSRMLLSDPPSFSDFSGRRERIKDKVQLPPGFQWVSEWTIKANVAVRDLVEDDTAEADTASNETPMSPRGEADAGFVYAANWMTSDFKTRPGFGNVIRRRLWIRKRKLLPPPDGFLTDTPPPEGTRTPPQEQLSAMVSMGSKRRPADEDDLSTDSSDMILDDEAAGVLNPLEEENNDESQ